MRELTERPVLGFAEASMHLACLLGRHFSIVTTNPEWEPLLMDAVHRYGLTGTYSPPSLLCECPEGKAMGKVSK